MNLLQRFCTNNYAYRRPTAFRDGKPSGIVLHSTGCNNKRATYWADHWNSGAAQVIVHAVIGLYNNKLTTIQLLPWNVRCWGCGDPGNKYFLQVEMCEDDRNDKAWLEKVLGEAVELIAMWCKEYDIPVSKVRSHKEWHKDGYATNHADPDHWLNAYGITMDDVRRMVADKLSPQEEIKEVVKEPEPVVEEPKPAEKKTGAALSGSIIECSATRHYRSSNALIGLPCKPGKVKVLRYYNGKHSYSCKAVDRNADGCTINGWVDAKYVEV